jgi:DNA-directed RNA polymerase specialized sigma24 family protein
METFEYSNFQPAAARPMVVEQPQFLRRLARFLRATSPSQDLVKDLFQEAFLCSWQIELRCPGQTISWYLQRGWRYAVAHLKRGRSIDSHDRRARGYSVNNERHRLRRRELVSSADVRAEVCARDFLRELVSKLKPHEQTLLLMLLEGQEACECAHELHISHRAVNKIRRRILTEAARIGLGHDLPQK